MPSLGPTPSQAEKQRLEEALNAAQEEEGSLAAAKRALEVRLDEAQRGLARMGQEQQALNRALEEEAKQREALRRGKAELEEQKRLLDRTVDRLNKEVGQGAACTREEAQLVQKLAWGDGVDVGQMCAVYFPLVHFWGDRGQIFKVWHPSSLPAVLFPFPQYPIPSWS